MDKPSLYVVKALLALLLLAIASGVSAQSGGGYDLSWSTIDGGGYTFSTGGDYILGGAIGQADAGVLAGGEYILVGGFWCGAPAQQVYLPLVLKK